MNSFNSTWEYLLGTVLGAGDIIMNNALFLFLKTSQSGITHMRILMLLDMTYVSIKYMQIIHTTQSHRDRNEHGPISV